MVAQPRATYTVEHYLQLERAGEARHEYHAGQISALAGGSERHNLIAAHILGILYAQVRGRHCKAYPGDMRVEVAKARLYTYPDISIVCGAAIFDDGESDTLLNPMVLFEILSPSTEKDDRGKKFEYYRAITTLREYILVSQESRLIEQYTRQTDNTWLLTVHDTPASRMDLASVGCTLLLADVYEDIALPSDEEEHHR